MRRILAVALLGASLLVAPAIPAAADHTKPREPLSELEGAPTDGVPLGEGTWTHIMNFPPNPGTDLEFFKVGKLVYSSSGTLGQADNQHVGQRILRLINKKGKVAPRWVADHGSANCPTANPAGTLGLQHDVQVTPKRKPQIIVDTTDATGRCHDPGGGGLELIDITKLRRRKFQPREIALTRYDGTSHNSTVDATRPWLIYNSSSDTQRAWIDVTDIRSCLGLKRKSLAEKRKLCRPKVYRIPFDPKWVAQINYDPRDGEVGKPADPNDPEGGGGGCHDITVAPGRLYCAAINGTVWLDVSNLTGRGGRVRGTPLPCKVIDATMTKAKVTNCDFFVKGQDADGNDPATEDAEAWVKMGKPSAKGWRHIGHINHPGKEDRNNQPFVESSEGVAVSHESDPTPSGKWLWVTDERGGGVVPPGSSCPGPINPYGNGGMHVFDLRNPSNPKYAQTPEGEKAVFISENVAAGPTFCNIHVIEKVPGEQRIWVSWYSQGLKVVDYFIKNGKWTFDEVASYRMPNTNNWAFEDFKIVNHKNGERTYYLLASDIQRGIDIVKWRGPTNRKGERADEVLADQADQASAKAKSAQTSQSRGPTGLLVAVLGLLPVASLVSRRGRRRIA